MGLKSEKFNVLVLGTHSIHIPEKHILPFIEAGHTRVKVAATHDKKTIIIYAAVRLYKGIYHMMFSKRNQDLLDLLPDQSFTLQFFENDMKYGVPVPEELETVLLSAYDAYTLFETLREGFQRSIIYTITRFKDSQKRIDVSLTLCENLKRGIRDRKLILKAL